MEVSGGISSIIRQLDGASELMYKVLPIVFFSIVAAYFLYGVSPDMTWMSIGADQINYVVAAQHNAPAGLSGNPLYIMLGALFVRLPGNDFWDLGLLSALPAIGTCIVIFLTVRKFSSSKFAPYLASLVFASSFPVWAESVVAETYMITAFCSSLVIYFCLTGRYYWMAAFMAVGVGLHPLGIWIALPCFIYSLLDRRKELGLTVDETAKFAGKLVLIILCGTVFRLRDLFTEPATTNLFFMDNPYENILNSAGGYFGNSVIPFYPTSQRIWEDLCALGSSLWAIVFAGFTCTKDRRFILLWVIFGLAVFFPFASLYPQWIKYMFLPILPLSILVGLGVDRLRLRESANDLLYLVLILVCVNFCLFNLITYSPGKTIDDTPTTARQFYNTLDDIPDNSIIVGHTWGHPDLVILYYSVETNDRLDYINYDSLGSQECVDWEYVQYQVDKGINMPIILEEDKEEGKISVGEFAKDLQELNPTRQVFVTYVADSAIPMRFSLVASAYYTQELNDVPKGKAQYTG